MTESPNDDRMMTQRWPNDDRKNEPTPNSCEEVGANWWWRHWKWVGVSVKKHFPSSGCSHKHAVAQHRHTCGGQQLKHTSPDGLPYWHTQPKLHLQTALPSSTLVHKPIWMGTPPSSATCSIWLRSPRPIPASPLTWWIFGLWTFAHLETGQYKTVSQPLKSNFGGPERLTRKKGVRGEKKWSNDDRMMTEWWSNGSCCTTQCSQKKWPSDDRMTTKRWLNHYQLLIKWWPIGDRMMIEWWSKDERMMSDRWGNDDRMIEWL